MYKFIMVLIFSTVLFAKTPDEGMYPLNEIQNINLQEKGLKINVSEIYNSKNVSLIDAIVKIGGCTGSFVSDAGLIITNHHCAYRAAQTASGGDNDYIQNGFIARNRSEEIEAKGYTIRITQSYKDVSREVLSVITDKMTPAERRKAMDKRSKELVKQAEKDHPGIKAEVSEMFKGKSYVLFIYTYFKDVRLVYVPPRSIGNFGGEIDNWEWPRHTGDFSFLRVYTAPDGSPADYSPENIPLIPKKYLKVSSVGVDEEAFVFIPGYPGRTYRHRSSYFLDFEERVHMPFVVEWYQWQIRAMEDIGASDRGVMLKHLSRIKGLANTEKNYRGKLQGMRRLHLVEKKRNDEKKLEKFIKEDNELNKKYSYVLEKIKNYYVQKEASAVHNYLLSYLRRSVNMIGFANTIYFASKERKKDDIERKSAYMDRNFERTVKRTLLGLENYYEETDKIIFKELVKRILALPETQRIKAVDMYFANGSIDEIIAKMYANSKLMNKGVLQGALTGNSDAIREMNDPFINFILKLAPEIEEMEKLQKSSYGLLTTLSAEYLEMREKYLKKNFIPDANGTLRLTYGYIRGYHPADAVYKSPVTSLNGIIEKDSGKKPFDVPQKLTDLYKNKDFGRFYNKKLKSIPVNLLYNCDTTGGNSGSPILNARGELVGINFDRAYEATINDFGWSEQYSRSIGVDIRYVLWILEKFAGMNYLLQEIGVSY